MDIQRLIQIADWADSIGLHALADKIDNVISSQPESEAIAFFSDPLKDLVSVANSLDKKGLTILADRLDRIIELEALEQSSAIDTIISIYKKKHCIASVRGFCKTATIRKNNLPEEQRCPFGLSIPVACMNVGSAIKDMQADPESAKENRTRYNELREKKPCPYAVDILEGQRGVNCSHGIPGAGQLPLELFHGSPIYPKLFEGFNTINIGREYFQYHDDLGFAGEM